MGRADSNHAGNPVADIAALLCCYPIKLIDRVTRFVGVVISLLGTADLTSTFNEWDTLTDKNNSNRKLLHGAARCGICAWRGLGNLVNEREVVMR